MRGTRNISTLAREEEPFSDDGLFVRLDCCSLGPLYGFARLSKNWDQMSASTMPKHLCGVILGQVGRLAHELLIWCS